MSEAIPLAEKADASSVDSIWTIETRLTGDAITPLAAYAANTGRIRVGSAGLPIWTRHPALIAQTFATLNALAPGRVVLGLSAWWNPLAARVGVKLERPITAMRGVIESDEAALEEFEPPFVSGSVCGNTEQDLGEAVFKVTNEGHFIEVGGVAPCR